MEFSGEYCTITLSSYLKIEILSSKDCFAITLMFLEIIKFLKKQPFCSKSGLKKKNSLGFKSNPPVRHFKAMTFQILNLCNWLLYDFLEI